MNTMTTPALFSMAEPQDILATLGIEHEHCAAADCTAPAAGIGMGYTSGGTVGISPVCAEHAKAQAAVFRAVQFDEYEVPLLLLAVSRRAIQRMIDADAFPFVARNPARLEQTALFFRNADGVPGFVGIMLPYEDGDRLVQRASSLAFICEELIAGKSLSFMGPTKNYRLLLVETSMDDFEPWQGSELAGGAQ